MNADLAILVLRVVVGGVVAMHGFLKLGWVGKGGSIAGVAGWFNGIGLRPGIFWALVATLAEAGGGTLMVLGLGGPIGPGIVAGDLVVVAIVAHWPQGFWAGGGKVGWEFPVPLAAAAWVAESGADRESGAAATPTVRPASTRTPSATGATTPTP